MRTKTLLLVGFLTVAGIASANVVPCSGNIGLSTILTNFAGIGNGCEIGDKIFSNFTETGLSSNVFATIDTLNPKSYVLDLHDPNGFATNFTLAYDVTIDSTQAPAAGPDAASWRIVAVSAGGQTNGTVGTAQLVKTVMGVGSETVNFANGGSTVTPGPIGVSATKVHVTDVFTQGSTPAFILDLSNTYTQADTAAPEPGTMFLMSGALIGLGLVSRKVRNRKA